MDPKNLDPKLKEAYDRVMGVDLSSSQPQIPTAPTQDLNPAPQAPNMPASPPPMPDVSSNPPIQDVRSTGISPSFETQSQQTVRPEDQLSDIPPPPPPLNPVEAPATPTSPAPSSIPPVSKDVFQSFNAANESAPQITEAPTASSAPQAKPKPTISPVILVFVGLIFFVIYAVLWGKIFGAF